MDPIERARKNLWLMFERAPGAFAMGVNIFITRTVQGNGWIIRIENLFMQALLNMCDIFLLGSINELHLFEILQTNKDNEAKAELIVESICEYPVDVAKKMFQNQISLLPKTKSNNWPYIPNPAAKERFFDAVMTCVFRGGVIFQNDAKIFVWHLLLQKSNLNLQDRAAYIRREILRRYASLKGE